MYVPHQFVADADDAYALIEAVGAVDLVTVAGVVPISTLVPVIWERSDPGHGRLLAHLARGNEQWRPVGSGGVPALAIAHGPQAYVSPGWYASKAQHGRVVPTWNYASVHLTGRLFVHDDPEWVRGLVTRLTERHEQTREQPWAVTDAPERFVDGQLRAIVGIELVIERLEAKLKLSQNRSDADQSGVVAGLDAEDPLTSPQAAAVAAAMRR